MNKTKLYFRFASIMIIPGFFSQLINMIVSFEYWQGLPCEEIKLHKLNHLFAFYGCMLGIFAFAFILVAFTSIWKYLSKIDKLDEVEQDYLKAKNEMQTARDKYTELLKKSKEI